MNLSDFILGIWIMVVGAGLGVAIWALVDNYVDRSALRTIGRDGNNERMVRRLLRSSWASVVLHSFFLLLGFAAITSPRQLPTPTVLIYSAGYILVATFNVRAILLNQLDRVRMRKTQAKEE